MKKIIAILTAFLMLSLTACSNTDSNSDKKTNSNSQKPISSAKTTQLESTSAPKGSANNGAAPAPDNNKSSSILIAYFTAAENIVPEVASQVKEWLDGPEY